MTLLQEGYGRPTGTSAAQANVGYTAQHFPDNSLPPPPPLR